MDRSQTRLLVVLSALLVGVAGVLYWEGEQDASLDPDATAEVWSVEPDQVTKIAVSRPEGPLELVKDGDTWKVDRPFDALADQGRVDELLHGLTGMKKGIPVDVPPDRAGDFGLSTPPSAHVEVTMTDGTTHAIDVGTSAAVGWRTYVRAADGRIAAATGDPGQLLHADADRFRDSRVFRFDPGKVRSVSVASPQGTLTVHGQGKRWTLEGFGRADPDKVDDWVTGLLDLRFDHQSDGPPVTEPTFTVDVALEGGEQVELLVGEETDMGDRASLSDGRVGVISPQTLSELGRGPTDVGQQTAFLVDPEATGHVRFEGLGKVFDAKRNGIDWASDSVQGEAATARVKQLAGIPVEYRLDPPPPVEVPEITVTTEDPDQPPVVWELGPAQPDGTRTLHERGSDQPGLRVPDAAIAGFVGELP